MVNTLDHLPLLPFFVHYRYSPHTGPTDLGQDELAIYHTLRLRGRIRHIELSLPPSILHKVLVLMDENFPLLEHLSLSCSDSFSADRGHRLPLTLPEGFLAPNLLRLNLVDIGLPVLTSTVSLVTLTLIIIQNSSYLHPKLLVAHLQSLPLLKNLTISFCIPIPHPSTESELLGEEGAPVTLQSLKALSFYGFGAYLDSLVAQIRVPILEKLYLKLFNQTVFALPNLFCLINNTTAFKLSSAKVSFYSNEVLVSMSHGLGRRAFSICVICKPLNRQIDCMAKICDALIPMLSGVEKLSLLQEIPTEMRNGAIDSATWCDLLRRFIGVKDLHILDGSLLEELSRALQVDEVGLDPDFLPNLRSIRASRNLFTSFIDARQVVGRPIVYPY